MFLTDLQKEILKRKGFNIEDEVVQDNIEKFLNPNWSRDIFDASKIKDIDRSIERIKKAIDKNEKIIIYADYDCDGIPGAVVLNDFFEKINYKNFEVYIPHRHNEGYGLNMHAVQKFINEKVNLVITVDVGITNLEEIKSLEESNINVIVTDHHLPIEETLTPDPFPIREEEKFPESKLGDRVFENFKSTADTKTFKYLKEIRETLKQKETKTEKILWKYLRRNNLNFHFRRQHIINNFIVDFVCLEKKLIVELDGKIHNYQKESDEERENVLRSFGFKILRFKNEDILHNFDFVLSEIESTLAQPTQKLQILPPAFAIVNIKQSDDKYEEKFLCGASTAWKMVHHFLNKYRKEFNVSEGWEKWLLDMVGIATIADLVPLRNENRLFAKYGLEVLKKSKRPGLQKILKNAKVDQKKICEDDIAFGIAPRINAASRMAEPMYAFYALLQNEDSLKYAYELERYNTLRKQDTKDANASINYEKFKNEKIILVGDIKWTPGIIGLIASKVSEKTSKTTFVWGVGEDKNILKGSVRAGSDGYNVVHIMTECKDILENFGGHEAAGGFALHKDNLENFQKFIRDYSEKNIFENINIQSEENILEENLESNFINLNIKDINRKIFDEVKIFAPFGVENEKPVFKINLEEYDFVKVKRFGKQNEHLEVLINGVRGVEFFVSPEREEELKNKKEFLVNLEWDNFRGDVMVKFVK